jgi:hypothetical protein
MAGNVGWRCVRVEEHVLQRFVEDEISAREFMNMAAATTKLLYANIREEIKNTTFESVIA